MKKIYLLFVALFLSAAISAQEVIPLDLTQVSGDYTTEVDGELALDVATLASPVASPNLYYENPFKGKTFEEAEISFDVYNYDTLHVLGALFGIYDSQLGRMYFTNGSYLGYNGVGGWYDANLSNYALDSSFLGMEEWHSVDLQFTNSGFALYVDDSLAYDESDTTAAAPITMNSESSTETGQPFSAYDSTIYFLQNADTLVFGTGSWWSDNATGGGHYWDVQYSYLKNIKFTTEFSQVTSIRERQKLEPNGEVLREEYIDLRGRVISDEYDELEPGLYIKKAYYSNGAVETTKIFKRVRY